MPHFIPAAPPLPTQQNEHTNKTAAIETDKAAKFQTEECFWALHHPEIQKACFLARICTHKFPKKCQYRNVNSILQEGPTCGLTALSMLVNGNVATKEILQCAKLLNYTYNGEMFSAKDLYKLLCDHLYMYLSIANNSDTKSVDNIQNLSAIECQFYQGPLDCDYIKECLMNQACLLVPYDADCNHEPCLKLGHKAHWALIIGYLISDENDFYVLARHGKARNLAAWSLKALSASNSNLVEFAQPNGYADCDFLLPPDGIGGDTGLRERAIVVKGLPRNNTTIC